jgi:putative salt-induced outer membrane protein YdiY
MDEEQAAMKERATEPEAEAGQTDGEGAVLATFAEMQESDRALARRLWAIMKASAPVLSPKTWYGVPADAKDGKVACFFPSPRQFTSRYATVGFADEASLDEGAMSRRPDGRGGPKAAAGGSSMRQVWSIGVVLLLLEVAPAPARAQEEAKRRWTYTAEFSLINTTGNTRTRSLALANKYVYAWTKADVTIDAAALWIETESVKTAESYLLAGTYRRNITDRFLWYGLGGWSRNEFAGFTDRYTVGGGLGYRFLEPEPHGLVGEFGLGYADEKRVPPNADDNWAEARGLLGYSYKLSETAKLVAELEVLDNLDDMSDWRSRSAASVIAAISKKLALKAGYTIVHDNVPVPGFKKTDTIFSASLVVTF